MLQDTTSNPNSPHTLAATDGFESESNGHVGVAIIGNGFSGMCAAISLKKRGITDFLIFDKAHEFGGTWRENDYPGCGCDVPVALYSFSFSPNPNWSQSFAGQREIYDYIQDLAKKFKLEPHLRGSHEVTALAWHEATGRWQITTTSGKYTADKVIASSGPLHQPRFPDIPGLDQFQGKAFHSAQWDHSYDLAGKRVAVIGTGASAIQFIPRIQPDCAKLTVFQRTPAWVAPRPQRTYTRGEKLVYKFLPPVQKLLRLGLFMRHESGILGFQHRPIMKMAETALRTKYYPAMVKNSEKREKLIPKYWMGCKRILLSNDYLPAMDQDNVDLVTAAVTQVGSDHIIDADGNRHDVDAIIFGTGFYVADPPLAKIVTGRNGETLEAKWQGSPKAFYGITIPDFPNLFLMVGPGTGLGHNSIILMIEAQDRRIMQILDHANENQIKIIDTKAETLDEHIGTVDKRMETTVWKRGNCNAWYEDSTGRISALWPGSTLGYRYELSKFDKNDYLWS